MNHQDPSGSRSPRTPTLSPKERHFSNPIGNQRRNQHQLHSPQRESSSWFGSVWNAFASTPTSSQQHRQQIQTTPKCNHSHLYGNALDEVHQSLMVPQVEDTTNDHSTYRIQPRPNRAEIDEEEEVFYMKKAKPLSPLRNRSPLMPSRPPMLPNQLPNQSPMQTNRFQFQPAPRSPYRQTYSPVPAPSSPERTSKANGNGLQQVVFGTGKRRATFWTLLLILMVGPTIFIGGSFIRHGLLESSNPSGLMEPESDNSVMLNTDQKNVNRALSIYDTNTFMVQDQVLNSGENKALPSSNQDAYLRQETNGNLILYGKNNKVLWKSGLNRGSSVKTAYMTLLQADGNLVTRSMTFDMKQMTWITSTDWSSHSRNDAVHHGEYLLMLTPDEDGLMVVRRMDSEVIWSTADVKKLDPPPPLPPPTNRPTPPPVQPPGVDPMVVATAPVGVPPVTPANSPPSFPWPATVPRSQEYSIVSGPMVGHTTHNSCKFWVFLGNVVMPMQLVYWPKNSNQGSAQTSTLIPDDQANNAAIKTIQGLEPDTVYLYEIRIKNEWLSQGHFKTGPLPDRPTSFKYVLASCMNVKSDSHRSQPAWSEVLKKDIDFAMLPGDTIYLNWLDWTRQWEVLYGRVWYRYLQQRAETNFARFIKTVPTYGTWDNHDYGTDYAAYDQEGKENSLKAWGDLWPIPYQGSSKGVGNYYSFSWGDVDFFVLDCRWYRNWSTGTLFGQQQLAWLEEELIASRATFKIIVSASDVMEQSMSDDLQTIGRVVARNSISGVLFNSGDIHRNEYKVQNIANWPYKVQQFSSSGIAVVWRRNFAIVNVNTALNNPEIRVEFHAAVSSAQSTSWSNDPNLICSRIQNKNRDQEAVCTQTIRLSDLKP